LSVDAAPPPDELATLVAATGWQVARLFSSQEQRYTAVLEKR
jgi:hypothetical protein